MITDLEMIALQAKIVAESWRIHRARNLSHETMEHHIVCLLALAEKHLRTDQDAQA